MIIQRITQAVPVPRSQVVTTQPTHPNGPGTLLKATLASLGIRPAPGCKCNSRARQMDLRGPDWCQEHMEEIVGWLKEEAERSGLPFFPPAARLLIRRCIAKSRALQPPCPTPAGTGTIAADRDPIPSDH